MADWPTLRDIRLLALRDAPDAFASTYARAKDATTAHLWVTETNSRARPLYEPCGFTPTPERQPLPSNPALGEIGMTRPLDPAKDLTTERTRVPAPAPAPSPA